VNIYVRLMFKNFICQRKKIYNILHEKDRCIKFLFVEYLKNVVQFVERGIMLLAKSE